MKRICQVLLAAGLCLVDHRAGGAEPTGWRQEGAHVRSLAITLPASGHAGFELLGPERTGVFFTNALALERHLTNQIYLNGSGVTAGDVDGDGRVDLFFAGLGGQSRLYRNLGDWKFRDITEEAGVGSPNLDATGAMLADLNGDGTLDLAVNSIGGGTRILFNDGKGHFTDAGLNPGFNAGRGGCSMALADFDGDGALDLYIGNYRAATYHDWPTLKFIYRSVNGKPVVAGVNGRLLTEPDLTNRFVFTFSLAPKGGQMMRTDENGEPDLLCRNDGHGRFTPLSWTDGTFLDEDGWPLARPTLDWTYSVVFRDLNGDGWPDLYTCGDFRSLDRIWINDGHGHFRALPRLAIRHTTLSSMGLDVADINRDGLDDIFVLEMLSRDHPLRFRQRQSMVPEGPPFGVIDSRPQYGHNMLFLNRGDGTYGEIAQLAGLEASDWSWTPLFLDVDLDGYEDLLVANGFERDIMNMDAQEQINSGKRTLDPLEGLRLRRLYPRIATPNRAFRNLGNLRFEEAGERWGFAHPGVSQGMVAADLDNDGDLDIVVNNLNGPAFLLRNETAAPRLAVRLKGRAPNTHGIGAKIRVQGGPVAQQQEIMAGGRYQSSDDAMRTFACGSATRLTIEVAWRGGQRSVHAEAQPNRIYELDEAGAESYSPSPWPVLAPHFQDVGSVLNHTHAEEAFNDFERQPLLPRKLSQLGPGVAWFDLDGDGWEDLFIGSGRGGMLGGFRNDGHGGFVRWEGMPFAEAAVRDQAGLLGWRGSAGGSVLLAGASNYKDGQAVGSSVRGYDLAAKGAGDQVAGQASSAGPMALADVDGDGELELFVGGRVLPGRYPMAASSSIYRRRERQWAPDLESKRRLAKAGLVSGAVFSDVDGDGDVDLILACEWGPVRVYRNEKGQFAEATKELGLERYVGWWNGVATGDFDEDGRMDIVASNWGRNTSYEGWRRQPLRMYYGDPDGSGTVQTVLAYEDQAMGKVAPAQAYDVASAAMPWLREKVATWTAYADGGLDEIYGDALKRLVEVRANCLETMLFLNRGDHFEARELPVEAQFAPAFAVCVGDLDGDGHEDVFLSQNCFAVPTEISRQDAGRGLWLRGDGQGGLKAVPGQESGLLVYGEQRGAAGCDYDHDGRLDLVVSQNAGPTKLFRNVGAKPGLRVRLKGGQGNPEAAGAVIRIMDGAGKMGPAREIHAGSGYWSQDAATQVLARPGGASRLWVRWPGGQISTNDIPSGAREIVVEAAAKTMSRPK